MRASESGSKGAAGNGEVDVNEAPDRWFWSCLTNVDRVRARGSLVPQP